MPWRNLPYDQQIIEAEKERNIESDAIKIEIARKEFVKKEFKKTIEIYRTVDHKHLLDDLDNKLIAFAELQIEKEPT